MYLPGAARVTCLLDDRPRMRRVDWHLGHFLNAALGVMFPRPEHYDQSDLDIWSNIPFLRPPARYLRALGGLRT